MTVRLHKQAAESSTHIEVTNPYSGKLIGEVPITPPEAINEAVHRAHRAWSAFRFSTPNERRNLLHALADKVRAEAEHLASIICAEVGKTITEARNEVRRAENTLRLSGDGATVLHGEIIPCAVVPGSPDKHAFITHEATGVVGAITPFNYPLNLLCHKLGPAIAAGNAVVAKPSPKAPLAATRLAELAANVGFPTGLFQIAHGASEAALSLARSEINILSFTGGTAAGQALKNATGLVRCLMELGGNDPLIIMPDADLDRAAITALSHRLEIAGQSCAAAKKIYIHEAVGDLVFDKIRQRVEAVRTGDPADQATDMGPVIDEAAAIEVERRIREATKAGAVLVCGGTRENAVIAPTLLRDVPEGTDIFRLETFGPVLATRTFSDVGQLIDTLNGAPYGLQAGVFTNDHALVRRFSRELRVGGVMINEGPDFRAENVPFGGIKGSGLGREGIHYTIREMSEVKVVID
jgi:acyl-CoA reductase-like NAD-dependent aldehyde dehydrogenase